MLPLGVAQASQPSCVGGAWYVDLVVPAPRRLPLGLGTRSQNRDVLGHGLLVVLAHGRADEGGLALEALPREKAHQSFRGKGRPGSLRKTQ